MTYEWPLDSCTDCALPSFSAFPQPSQNLVGGGTPISDDVGAVGCKPWTGTLLASGSTGPQCTATSHLVTYHALQDLSRALTHLGLLCVHFGES